MDANAQQITALVANLVASDWPTTESERLTWARRMGLPEHGDPVPGLDELSDRSRSFEARAGMADVGWHFFDEQFVGVHFFWNESEDMADLEPVARDVREGLRVLWETTEELEDEVQGFTALWHPQDRVVDMYWHAPRLMPEGHRSTGTIQLHVDHRDRSDARNRHDEGLQSEMD
ncbi:hypothetical protein AAEX63_15525 [Luteococcus sp. H138]|uniref:hypothetical protein n=1 Tax=unclassified Luteococcus TaxID=2639923 RepID=UPI00313EBCA9